MAMEHNAAQSDIENLTREIDTTLSLAAGEKINVCYALLKLIDSAPEEVRASLLRHATETYEASASSEEMQVDDYVTKDELKRLIDKYGKLVNTMLEVLTGENLLEDQFYSNLWSVINNPVLPDDKARAFAFYWLMIDKRLPYFHLESGLKMSDEDFRSGMKRLASERAKIRFIMNRDFSQRTEQADLLLKEIDSAQPTDKVFMMVEVVMQTKAPSDALNSMLSHML